EALSVAGTSSAASQAEARSYLLDLWQESPGDGEVNLQLARLASRTGDDASARRYYENAIAGVWEGDAIEIVRRRRQARLEFYRYLLERGDQPAALAVLSEIPPAPGAGEKSLPQKRRP